MESSYFQKVRMRFETHSYKHSYSLISPLTLSWWRFLSYRNQSVDSQSKSMDWFLYMIGTSVMKELMTLLLGEILGYERE